MHIILIHITVVCNPFSIYKGLSFGVGVIRIIVLGLNYAKIWGEVLMGLNLYLLSVKAVYSVITPGRKAIGNYETSLFSRASLSFFAQWENVTVSLAFQY